MAEWVGRRSRIEGRLAWAEARASAGLLMEEGPVGEVWYVYSVCLFEGRKRFVSYVGDDFVGSCIFEDAPWGGGWHGGARRARLALV